MSNKIYDVLTISRYIINKCNEKKYIISNLKLQKLLYFVQGFSMAINHKKCFYECIQAWDYGPVCPVSYHEFKNYGANNIPPIKQFTIIEYDDDKIEWVEKKFDENNIDLDTRNIIDEVIDNYASYSASALVDITHSQKPWRETYYSHPSEKNVVIEDELIEKYFTERISND